MDNQAKTREIAIIAGVFAIIAALITGFFVIGNTLLVDYLSRRDLISTPVAANPTQINYPAPTVVSGLGNDSESQPEQPLATATKKPEPTPTQLGDPFCVDWEICWVYDDAAKTMQWTGSPTGDIGQKGTSLAKLKEGYTAIVITTTEMKINICTGSVDGKHIANDCTPQILTLLPGRHEIISSGFQGGFRVNP